MGRKAGLLIVLGFFLLCFGTPPVYGKGYPEKDIKIYIPVGPGGSMDFMTRGAATFLEKSLKVRIFMENTSGSSGGIAYNRVYKMKPDGYNLVVFGLPTLLLTSLNQQVAFKAEEFSPIFGWGWTVTPTRSSSPCASSVSRRRSTVWRTSGFWRWKKPGARARPTVAWVNGSKELNPRSLKKRSSSIPTCSRSAAKTGSSPAGGSGLRNISHASRASAGA